MMDEQLIAEVEQHGVIYNRQKYFLNSGGGCTGRPGLNKGCTPDGKYETKDEAWQIIAIKLRSNVETCKKRWKYLRERYVSQRKQGDPPVYEHLSRPYLEKMKFIDQHIQPRKSYRNVSNFLTSPSAHSSGFAEYNMDSSKSNGSLKNMHGSQYQDSTVISGSNVAANTVTDNENGNSTNVVKTEADQAFRDFAAAVASQQLHHMGNSQTNQNLSHHQSSGVAGEKPSQGVQNYDQYRGDNSNANVPIQSITGGIASYSSSIKTPMSSPPLAVPTSKSALQSPASTMGSSFNNHPNDALDQASGNNLHMKKPRVQLNANAQATSSAAGDSAPYDVDSDDDSDVDNIPPLNHSTPSHYQNSHGHYNHMRGNNSAGTADNNQNHHSMFPANADFLFSLYQQMPPQYPQQHSHAHLQQLKQEQQQQQHSSQHFNKLPIMQTPPNRSSEHLLGELVTTELLKMSKERRKNVQKRILEILFFDD